jgi:hypothetical protein
MNRSISVLVCSAVMSSVIALSSSTSVPARVIIVPRDFNTIQAAINAAVHGDEVVLLPWTFVENISIGGKNIVLRSTAPTSLPILLNTVVRGRVTFSGTESSGCVLDGLTITGSQIYGVGGGVSGNRTHATIRRCLITGNWAAYGGGIAGCDGVIEFNYITSNSATFQYTMSSAHGNGGGLYDCNGLIQNNAILWNSVFSVGPYFKATGGGLAQCQGTIRNNVIAGNRASWNFHSGAAGAGLYGCHGLIQNNTIYGNEIPISFGSGAGLENCPGQVVNCIIWGNTCNGTTAGANVGRDVAPTYSCIQDGPTTQGHNISVDPGFLDPANNDFHLRPDSPCIDCGVLWLLNAVGQHDLDAGLRLVNGAVDIGADEFGSVPDTDGDLLSDADEVARGTDPFRPDTDGDGLTDWLEVARGLNPLVPNVPLPGFTIDSPSSSIQYAIFLAGEGERITVMPGVYHELLSFIGKGIVLQSNLTSGSSVIEQTILDGGGQGPVISVAGAPETAAVRGLTIRNGFAVSGGCIFGSGSKALIENNRILNGRAAQRGGALSDCDGPIRGNTIANHVAPTGGALYGCDGVIENNSITSGSAENGGLLAGCNGTIRGNTLTYGNASALGGGLFECLGLIENNTISSNTALNGGGAIGGTGTHIFTIRGNRISGNHVGGFGGGVYGCTNSLIENNTILNNSSGGWGGGLYWFTGELRYNLIAGNSATGNGGGLGSFYGAMEDNLIGCNTAGGQGGGMYLVGGRVQNNLVYGNIANAGGAISSTWQWILLRNNIFSANQAAERGGALNEVAGTFIEYNTIYGSSAPFGSAIANSAGSIRNCLIWAGAGGSPIVNSTLPEYCDIQDWTLGGTGNISVDPRVILTTVTTEYAGRVPPVEIRLSDISPCIDAGTAIFEWPGSASYIATDFEGDGRPYPARRRGRGDGSGFDIGADEWVPVGGRPNLRPSYSDFYPCEPLVMRPGEPITVGTLVRNLGMTPAGPFGVEFWGSRDGGMTLHELLVDPYRVERLASEGAVSIVFTAPLRPIPEELYSVVAVVDRADEVAETCETDNQELVRRKHLPVVRSQAAQTEMKPSARPQTKPPAPAARPATAIHRPARPNLVDKQEK